MTILDRIVAVKRKELEETKRLLPFRELEDFTPQGPVRDFRGALQGKRCGLIAEVKRVSPSKGVLKTDFDPADIATTYERCGAAAISVLTDKTFFGGEGADLTAIREKVSLPVLRKDFIIDPYQLYESRLMGADAVLLIVSVLGKGLRSFLRLAKSMGLQSLVEIHSDGELATALDAGAVIIGINNRDLRTFETDIERSISLMPLVPGGITVISESGIRSGEDVNRLEKAGIHAFLVGEALMKADDLESKMAELLGG